jgi:hypothetical protein
MDYSARDPESGLQSTPSVTWPPLPPSLHRLVLRARQQGYAILRGNYMPSPERIQ